MTSPSFVAYQGGGGVGYRVIAGGRLVGLIEVSVAGYHWRPRGRRRCQSWPTVKQAQDHAIWSLEQAAAVAKRRTSRAKRIISQSDCPSVNFAPSANRG